MKVLRGPGSPVGNSDHQWLEKVEKKDLKQGDLVTWGAYQCYETYTGGIMDLSDLSDEVSFLRVPHRYDARYDGLEGARKSGDEVKSGDKGWLEKVDRKDLSPGDLITYGYHLKYKRVKDISLGFLDNILRVPAFMDAAKCMNEEQEEPAAFEQISAGDYYHKRHDAFLEPVEEHQLAPGDLITWGTKTVYAKYSPQQHTVLGAAYRVPPKHGGQEVKASEQTRKDVVGTIMKLRECKPGWTVEYIDDGEIRADMIGQQRAIKLITEDMVYYTNGAVVQGGYKRSVRVVATTPQTPEKQEKMSTEEFQKAMGGLAAMQSGGGETPEIQTLGTAQFIVPRELILQKLREVEGMPKDITLEDFYMKISVQSSEFKHHNTDHLLGIEETQGGWAVEGTHAKKVDPALAFRQ